MTICIAAFIKSPRLLECGARGLQKTPNSSAFYSHNRDVSPLPTPSLEKNRHPHSIAPQSPVPSSSACYPLKIMSEHSFCPVFNAINVLQEKWTLHIIRGLLSGPTGFNELRRVAGGVNAATLSQRLEGLEQLGILTKTIQSTMPPRTSYQLTPAGVALQSVVDAIDCWARDNLPAPEHRSYDLEPLSEAGKKLEQTLEEVH